MLWRLVLSLLFATLLADAAQAQTGCVPNPNASGPPFVNGCGVPASALNNLTFADVRVFGAKCDGTTDDAAKINTALASGAAIVSIPAKTCAYGSTLNIPAGVSLVGQSRSTSILKPLAVNLTAISLNGNDSGFRHLNINCGAAGANSSSNCVTVGAFREMLMQDFIIGTPFVGIGMTTGVLITIENGYIYNPTATTGSCIVINGGNNQVINNVFCQGVLASQPRSGIDIIQTGGLWMNNFQVLYGGTPELVEPGTGQSVTWVFENQSTYDTSSGNGISLAPTGTGIIRGYYCTECWTSTNTLSGVTVQTGASGTIDDVHLIGHRSYNNGQYGIAVSGSSLNTYIVGGSVCGNSTSGLNGYDGINIQNTASHATISGVRVGNCAQFTTNNQKNGISASTTANINISNNDLTGNSTAALSYTASAPCIVAGNLAVNNASYAGTCTGM